MLSLELEAWAFLYRAVVIELRVNVEIPIIFEFLNRHEERIDVAMQVALQDLRVH